MKIDKTISVELIKLMFTCTENGEVYFSNHCGKSANKRADNTNVGLYNRVAIFKSYEYSHRIIFAYFNGYYPEIVDHIDGNTKNNSINNLRAVDTCQSVWNTKTQDSFTKVKGVHFEKYTNKYRAEIRFRGKNIRLGRFITLDEAIRARKDAEIKYHGEYARK